MDGVPVTGRGGWRGRVDPTSLFGEMGERNARILLDSGEQIVVPTSALAPQQDGSFYLPLDADQIRAAAVNSTPGSEIVIPVMREELSVERQRVETGGVRVHKTVTERQEVIDQPIYREDVQVERIPINQVVEGPVPIRYEGDTTIIPLLEEVLVVRKQLMLKEEVRITKRGAQVREPQTVTVRSEEAHLERISPNEAPGTDARGTREAA